VETDGFVIGAAWFVWRIVGYPLGSTCWGLFCTFGGEGMGGVTYIGDED
jgi:hypothetical protein